MSELATDLLGWYDLNKRSLPWRDVVSPYRTWVSEIMLQQTRVDTVLGYFERFMMDFPTVEALAQAPLDQVLSAWAGLGYYSRARNLHAAARAVVARGDFPSTVTELQTLPGIGRYTAGAIASIAFGSDEPAVDGNVERVLSRVHAAHASRLEIERRCRADLPPGRAGDFNQALMDLGSAICVPLQPACLLCPIASHCRARARGVTGSFPRKKQKKPVPEVPLVALVWRAGDRLLFGRRPPSGLFGGLYDLPTGERLATEDPMLAAARIGREVLGVEVAVGEVLAPVVHVLTHRRLHVTPVRVASDLAPESDRYDDLAWWRAEDVVQVSTLTRKVLAMISVHARTVTRS